MPSNLKLKDFEQVLIVEGYSDLVFYAELLESLDKLKTVFIQHFNGKQDLIVKLEDFITPQLLAEKRRIGIIVDADRNAASTFESVRAALQRLSNQNVPAVGTWTDGKPQVGIFVTPDGVSSGEIETLVWRAWTQEAASADQRICVETFVQCMEGHGFAAQSPDKGLISALLAIRYDEDPRLGPGARSKVFDLSRSEYQPLQSFLSTF
jgi:hypothetical protein